MKLQILIIALVAVWLATSAKAQEPEAQGHRRVALVLGGGGAKGAAEVGVLKVLEREGIQVDCVTGTSIGAIIGGLWACGYTATELDSMFCSQEWLTLLTDHRQDLGSELYKEEDGVVYVLGFPVMRTKDTKGKDKKKGGSGFDISGLGAIRGDHIVHLLDSMVRRKLVDERKLVSKRKVGKLNFDRLPVPFRCVVTDVKSMSVQVLSEGDLAHSMRASMALPGVFKPVKMDDRIYLDGGVLNNLPVDVGRAMGADVVIAVDLTQKNPGFLDFFYQQNKADADILIHPQLGAYDIASFGKNSIVDMIRLGEEAATQMLPQLKSLSPAPQDPPPTPPVEGGE